MLTLIFVPDSTTRQENSTDCRPFVSNRNVLGRWDSYVGSVSISMIFRVLSALLTNFNSFRWNEQREYMNMSWNCGKFLATVFVLVNLLGQVGGVVMVLARLRVQIACGLLFFIVVLQVKLSAKLIASNRWLISLLDHRLFNPLGSSILAEKLGAHRCAPSCPRRVPRRSSFSVRWRSKHGREQTQKLHAARWTNLVGVHVHYTHPLRAELFPDRPRHRRLNVDGSRHRWRRRDFWISSTYSIFLSRF